MSEKLSERMKKSLEIIEKALEEEPTNMAIPWIAGKLDAWIPDIESLEEENQKLRELLEKVSHEQSYYTISAAAEWERQYRKLRQDIMNIIYPPQTDLNRMIDNYKEEN